VSQDELADIARYFTRKEQQLMRPFNRDPHHLRWLSYGILILGLGLAICIYVAASPPPHHPLGDNPFTSKKYLRELELYGGKMNILAVEFRQWFDRLWQGKHLAYTIALLTISLSSLLWFISSPAASHHDTQAEKPHAPSDAWS
jgi:hypothetical protein